MRRLLIALAVASALAGTVAARVQTPVRGYHFDIFRPPPHAVIEGPVDGRVLLIIAKSNDTPPMNQVGRGLQSQPLFGVDVEGLNPGQSVAIDGTTRGWPVESLRDIPPGDYYAQAVLNVYTTVTRADGYTIKVHLDRGEGQNYRTSPGNLVSDVTRIRIDPRAGGAATVPPV